jgi:hypothetical protein
MSDFAQVFDDYFAAIVEANALAVSRGKDDARDLVHLRRRLAQLIVDVQVAVDTFVSVHGLQQMRIPELALHRTMFSAERRAISNHQSRWNAPEMNRDRAGYATACRDLFRMHEQNHAWRKDVLTPALASALKASTRKS